MVIAVPQFRIDFELPRDDRVGVPIHAHGPVALIVSGEDALDHIVKTLRWNGVRAYTVKPWDIEDEDPRRFQ